MALTPKRQRFVDEYLVDLNATAAARRAGYSARSAETEGSRLLGNAEVAAAIAAAKEARAVATGITTASVLERLDEVANRCMQRVPVMVFNREERRMEQEVDGDGNHVWTFDSAGACRALELLGKHTGAWKERVEVSASASLEALIAESMKPKA